MLLAEVDANTLLSELRDILHDEPCTRSWEALKASLLRALVEGGDVGKVAEDYVRGNIGALWPEQYGPLLEMWLLCVGEEGREAHRERKERALGVKLAHRINRRVLSSGR